MKNVDWDNYGASIYPPLKLDICTLAPNDWNFWIFFQPNEGAVHTDIIPVHYLWQDVPTYFFRKFLIFFCAKIPQIWYAFSETDS